MADLDYRKLGMMCGIEIHQMLDTHKLFCPCPSLLRDDEPDIRVMRRMRAVAGEMGEVDRAALHETVQGKKIIYEAYSDTTCLVELDEEPPHPLNQEALKAVLTISSMLSAKVFDELQVMRKTVVDGSNTAGFQRTILAAEKGFVETSLGRVGIATIALEEDAARKTGEKEGEVVYRVDRLGIPLIEIGTDPDIKSPAHARETAEKLGLIIRASGAAKRGLGTIRQDLNVSIRSGARVEVKGVQDLRLIKKVVESEVRRQVMLVGVKEEIKKRLGSKGEDVREGDMVDLTSIFRDTKCTVIREGYKNKKVVLGVKLRKLKGLLKNKLGPELAQYARASSKAKGIYHSDELPANGITPEEVNKVSNKLELKDNDAFALVCEEKAEAYKALAAVLKRIRLAYEYVVIPEETRRALPDGRSEYLRPLPGAARMYPETDEPPTPITDDLKRVALDKKEMPEEIENRFVEMGLSQELAKQMVRSRMRELFEECAPTYPKLKVSLVASTLLSAPKEAKKRFGVDTTGLADEHFKQIFTALSSGKLSKDVVVDLVAELSKSPSKTLPEIVEAAGLGSISGKQLEKIVEKIIKENKDLIEAEGDKAANKLLGKIMAETKGRADPAEVRKTLANKIS